MSGYSFYLTHVVANTPSCYDWFANQCLKPLHTLIRLTDSTQVRIFLINRNNEAKEVSPAPDFKRTIRKTIQVVIALICVVPGTACAIALKGSMWLCDKDFATRMQIIKDFKHVKIIWHAPLEEKMGSRIITESNRWFDYFSSLPVSGRVYTLEPASSGQAVATFLTRMCPFLTIDDLACLQSVSVQALKIMHAEHSIGVGKYAIHMHELDKDRLKSYAQLIKQGKCQAVRADYRKPLLHLQAGELIKTSPSQLFGGVGAILCLQPFQMNIGFGRPDKSDIIQYIRGEDVKDKPSIFRLQAGTSAEAIVIKYSLFVPQERRKGGEGDTVWQDYLILWGEIRYAHDKPNKIDVEWKYRDIREESRDTPFSGEGTALHDFSLLQKLLRGEIIGLLRATTYDSDTPASRAPLRYETTGRVFIDIPVVLGHVSIKEMQLKMHSTPPKSYPRTKAGIIQRAEEVGESWVKEIVTFWPKSQGNTSLS